MKTVNLFTKLAVFAGCLAIVWGATKLDDWIAIPPHVIGYGFSQLRPGVYEAKCLDEHGCHYDLTPYGSGDTAYGHWAQLDLTNSTTLVAQGFSRWLPINSEDK